MVNMGSEKKGKVWIASNSRGSGQVETQANPTPVYRWEKFWVMKQLLLNLLQITAYQIVLSDCIQIPPKCCHILFWNPELNLKKKKGKRLNCLLEITKKNSQNLVRILEFWVSRSIRTKADTRTWAINTVWWRYEKLLGLKA